MAWCSLSTHLRSSTFRLVPCSIGGVASTSRPSVTQLTSIHLRINTFSRWGVSSCFPHWWSGHFVTVTLLPHSKQTAQLRWRRPIKWNARRWMLWLFLLPSPLADELWSCPVKAETVLLKINYCSYCFVNTDQLNVAFDCILMFDLRVSFSCSYTIICICGEGPALTRLSATSCQLSSKVQVGNLVNLGWAIMTTIPRFVEEMVVSITPEGGIFLQ